MWSLGQSEHVHDVDLPFCFCSAGNPAQEDLTCARQVLCLAPLAQHSFHYLLSTCLFLVCTIPASAQSPLPNTVLAGPCGASVALSGHQHLSVSQPLGHFCTLHQLFNKQYFILEETLLHTGCNLMLETLEVLVNNLPSRMNLDSQHFIQLILLCWLRQSWSRAANSLRRGLRTLSGIWPLELENKPQALTLE